MAKVSGGDKFKAALGKIVKKMKVAEDVGGSAVHVGFLEGATYPDGKSVAFVAAMNEYGHRVGAAPGEGEEDNRAVVPPRPFFRTMIAQHKAEWAPAMAAILKRTDYNVRDTLLMTGEGVAGQLRQSIIDFDSIPLAQSTIDRKGFSKELVDSGVMLNSIDYEIK